MLVLGAAVALGRGAHLGIDYFVGKLPVKTRIKTEIFAFLCIAAFSLLVMVVGGLVLLAASSPRLTLLMLALVPPVALGAVVVGRRMSKLARAAQDALARANEAAEGTGSAG